MWCLLWSEFPLYALCGVEITDMFIRVLDKFYQFMDFSGCSNEVRAVITPHDGWFPCQVMKRGNVAINAAVVSSVTGSNALPLLTERQLKPYMLW